MRRSNERLVVFMMETTIIFLDTGLLLRQGPICFIKFIPLCENCGVFILIQLEFVPKGLIDVKAASI